MPVIFRFHEFEQLQYTHVWHRFGLGAMWLHTAFSLPQSGHPAPQLPPLLDMLSPLLLGALAFTLLGLLPCKIFPRLALPCCSGFSSDISHTKNPPTALPSKAALPSLPQPCLSSAHSLLHYLACFSVALPAVWCYIMHRLFSFAGLILYESGDFAGLVSVISTSTDKVLIICLWRSGREYVPLGVSAYKQGHIGLGFSFHILTIDQWVGLLDI